ncbi:MAG: histidine kinase [Flavobacteriales bacterium]|nr:histidine kinase [Flavobacteriales bacterium]
MQVANSVAYRKFTQYNLHHVAFWVVYFIFWVLFYDSRISTPKAIVNAFVTISVHALTVYFNIYFLFNQLFRQKLYLSYVISLLLTVLLASVVWILALYSADVVTHQGDLKDPWEIRIFIASATSIIYTLAITMSLKMVKQWYERERLTENLERINMETELKYLKTQINPHFLFNSLNSLYALTLQKSDRAPELVLRLSEILRYVLYEGSEKWVSLEKEISYLKSYLELEKARNGERLNLEFVINGNTGGKQIAPMMFLTFLENSFKHGINQKADGGFVRIEMNITDNLLNFNIRNSKPEEKEQRLNGKSGGIGLDNIKKRLELLYPNKHKLIMEDDGKEYCVNLDLMLN